MVQGSGKVTQSLRSLASVSFHFPSAVMLGTDVTHYLLKFPKRLDKIQYVLKIKFQIQGHI